jgi:tight adherence protein B
MTTLAALCFGLCAYAAVGLLVGHPVRIVRARRARPTTSRQELWLAQAGLALTPARFWAGSVAVGAAAFAIGTVLTGAPLVALAPALAVATLPRTYYGRRRVTRLRAIQAAWPDGLRDIAASLAAGRSLSRAVEELVDTGPPPLRAAFSHYAPTARMLGTAPALELVKAALADPTSDRVIEVLVLASERGGPIVTDIIDDLVVTTTKDVKVLDEIETEGLEMRINGRAVLVLPWLVLVALTVRDGAFRDFYQSTAGLLVVVIGAALSAVGYAWISRLGRPLEERRVFGRPRAATSAR